MKSLLSTRCLCVLNTLKLALNSALIKHLAALYCNGRKAEKPANFISMKSSKNLSESSTFSLSRWGRYKRNYPRNVTAFSLFLQIFFQDKIRKLTNLYKNTQNEMCVYEASTHLSQWDKNSWKQHSIQQTLFLKNIICIWKLYSSIWTYKS